MKFHIIRKDQQGRYYLSTIMGYNTFEGAENSCLYESDIIYQGDQPLKRVDELNGNMEKQQ